MSEPEDRVRGAGGEGGREAAFEASFEAMGRLARASIGAPAGAMKERLARGRFVARVRGLRGGWSGRMWFVTLGAAVGLAALAVVAWQLRPAGSARDGNAELATPLLAGGSVVRFPEGSELRFEAEGRGRIADSNRDGARVVLEQGVLNARVVHRPNSAWRIEAGPFTVLVTGTAFRVGWERQAGRFELVMREGSVTVLGPSFSQRLSAGQTLRATTTAGIVRLGPNDEPAALPAAPARPGERRREAAAGAPPEHSQAAARPAAPRRRAVTLALAEPEAGRTRAAAAAPSLSWSQRLAQGGFRDVVAEASAAGIDAVVAGRELDDLAALATAARLSGELEIARRALAAVRARFAGTGAAAESAFLLGRLADDVDHNPAAAVGWYERSLAEAPSGPLAPEALGRKLAALARLPGAEAQAAAGAAARLYLDRFPSGSHAARARALVAPR